MEEGVEGNTRFLPVTMEAGVKMNACQFEFELLGFLREDVLGLTTEDGGVIGDSCRDDATELGVTGSFLTIFLTKLSKGPELKSLT